MDESKSTLASNFCWIRSELRWTTTLYKNVCWGLYQVLCVYGNIELITIQLGKRGWWWFSVWVCQIVCKLCEPYREENKWSESDSDVITSWIGSVMAVLTEHGDGTSLLSRRLNNALFISMSAQQMFWLLNEVWREPRKSWECLCKDSWRVGQERCPWKH